MAGTRQSKLKLKFRPRNVDARWITVHHRRLPLSGCLDPQLRLPPPFENGKLLPKYEKFSWKLKLFVNNFPSFKFVGRVVVVVLLLFKGVED